MRFYEAMTLIERGHKLVLTTSDDGDGWSIQPAGARVNSATAQSIVASQYIEPVADALIQRPQSYHWKSLE